MIFLFSSTKMPNGMLQVEYRAEPHIFMISKSRGIRKKYFKKLKKISKKNYFFQKKTLAERHVTLFRSRRTVMN